MPRCGRESVQGLQAKNHVRRVLGSGPHVDGDQRTAHASLYPLRATAWRVPLLSPGTQLHPPPQHTRARSRSRSRLSPVLRRVQRSLQRQARAMEVGQVSVSLLPAAANEVIESSVQDRRVGSFAGTAHRSRESMVHGDGPRHGQHHDVADMASNRIQIPLAELSSRVLVVCVQQGPGVFVRFCTSMHNPFAACRRIQQREFPFVNHRGQPLRPKWFTFDLWRGVTKQRESLRAQRGVSTFTHQ